MKLLYTITILLLFSALHVNAQRISGVVYSEDGSPLPYANVFVQQSQTGTATDEGGAYVLNLRDPGEYNIIFSALGYESQEIVLFVEADMERSVILKPSDVQLEQIVVNASKKDPAYAIIQKAVENKKKFLRQVQSYKATVYVKAVEEIEEFQKEEKKESIIQISDTPEEAFENAAEEQAPEVPNINLLEMELILNYQYPKQYKEERMAYKAYGSKAGLYIPRFGETDFNFYRNLVFPQAISQVPIVSPLSSTAILSYKYKLIQSTPENGILVHKIKVIPRKVGNATCSGFIYINEGIWNINRLDLALPKGGLKLYDAFAIKQDYEQVADSLWMPFRQELSYETKQGKKRNFKGNTLIRFKDFEQDYVFPPKFFGNELAVTTQEAYERDSSYWEAARIEPLTKDIQKMVAYRDSIEAIYNSDDYKDSVDAAFNKITFLEILWDGVGLQNHRKQDQWFLGSLPSFIGFEVVGGFRVNPYISYFKRWENGQRIFTSLSGSVGLRNQDLLGDAYVSWFYNPHRLSRLSVDVGRSFQSINPYDAFINQFSVSNYILHDAFRVDHRTELFNGFYLNASFSFSDRRSVQGLDGTSFLQEIAGETEPLQFEPYQALITEIGISYTPGQRFMTEPNRKVVLGSKYPTFTFTHRKGWEDQLASDINFDYVEVAVDQDLQLGTLGSSKYNVEAGKFINTKRLQFIDFRRFRQSDRIWYSNPLRSYQLLDTALTTSEFFIETHFIHHFNGAIMNFIPYVKKLRINTVVGGGFLWVQENNYRYEEVFAGIERVFKLGPRRRLRLGVYGVVATSNQANTTTGFKVSVDVIDTWKRNWDF